MLLLASMELQRRGSQLLFGTFLYYLVRLHECEKLDGYMFPVYSTQLCPKNETEWIERSSDLNCTKHTGYICLPNQDFTKLLEFCYTEPFVRIQKGVCLSLVKGVSKLKAYNCSDFNYGCPTSFYISNRVFEHQACTSIGNGCFLADPSCDRSTSTILRQTTEQMHTENIPSNDIYNWVIAIIPVSIILLYIFLVLFINNRKCTVCKRITDEEQTQVEELQHLFNEEPHIANIWCFCANKPTKRNVPSVKIFVESPVNFGSETTIKSFVSSTPSPKKIEWQESRNGIDFYCIDKPIHFENNDIFTSPCHVIPKTTFDDKLHYRLLVLNEIGESVSNTLYLNVTGSPPNIRINLETNFKTRTVKLIGNVFIYDDSPGIIEYYWTKNDTRIHVDTEESGGKQLEMNTDNPSLSIRDVGPDDVGEYRITAINAVGSHTSEVIVLGLPMVFVEKTEDEPSRGQRITVTIRSFPFPFHVQWITKRIDDENFTPIDINTKEYEGTTVSFPNPVLVVRQRDQLEKNCFKIEVTNFIGKTVEKISGDDNQVVLTKPGEDNQVVLKNTDSGTIDPECSLQDLVRCDICETPPPSLICDICETYLCNQCKEKHLSDRSREHKLVSFKLRSRPKYVTKCLQHSSIYCKYYCIECGIPICESCVTAIEHRKHTFKNVIKQLESQKMYLKRDLEELKKKIYPTYQKIVSYIYLQKDGLNENSQKLAKAIKRHEEDSHNEINNARKKLIFNLDEMKLKHFSDLNEWEYTVQQNIFEITHTIEEIYKLLNSNDINLVSAYKSRNYEFKNLPPKLIVSLPSFTPQLINKDQIHQQFGSLSDSFIKKEEHGFTVDYPGVASCSTYRPLIDEPYIITDINTNYGTSLCNVSCLSDENIWTCGFNNNIMKLYNLQGELVKEIQTSSGKDPRSIATTSSGDLVYTDYWDRTVNIVKNNQIQEVIRLQHWVPCGVCSTLFGDLLVVMYNKDDKQTKVVCYNGSTEKQSIQFNDNGKPLYSSGGYNKYISENRNQDICVSDNGAHAIVVVNQAGTLRFIYTGHCSTTERLFSPCGITTDSEGRILTADIDNNCIYILDQDGQFLRYIYNCALECPSGICVDTKDNLFVAENSTSKLKKIQYCIQ